MPQNPNQPFSEYLTAPIQPQTPNPTGFESPATAAMLIGKNLLDGFRQGRLQKAAQIERENEKAQRSLEGALEYLGNLKDADPEVIEPYKAKLTQQYLQMIGSSKESSKDTGNPLTDVFKNIATNLSGGPMPKQKGPIVDPNLINEAMLAAVNPENSRYNRMGKAASDIAGLIKSVGIGDQRAALGHEQITPLLSQYRRLAGDPEAMPDSLKVLPADPFAATYEKFRMAGLKGMENGPSKSSGNIHEDYANILQYIAKSKALKLDTGVAEPVGGKQPENIYSPNLKEPTSAIFYSGMPGYQTGYYSVSDGKLIPGAYKGQAVNPSTANQVMEISTSPGAPKQAFMINKTNNSVNPLNYQGNPVYNFPLDTFRNQDVIDPNTGSAYSNIVRLNAARLPASQPVPMAPQAASSASAQAQLPTSSNQVQATSSTTRPPVTASTQSVTRPPTPVQTSSVPRGNLKKMGLDPEFIKQKMEDAESGAISREDLIKESGGNPNNFAVLRNNMAKNNIQLLSKDQIAGLKNVSTLSRLGPMYEELANVLKSGGSKTPVVQYVNGLIDDTFPWRNPKATQLARQINTELSNIAKGVSGEVRPTDADALRMVGWGPTNKFTFDLNQANIKRFKEVLRNEFKLNSTGVSEQQLEKIIKARPKDLQKLFSEEQSKPVNPFRNRGKK